MTIGNVRDILIRSRNDYRKGALIKHTVDTESFAIDVVSLASVAPFFSFTIIYLLGPELKQENRGETKHLLLGGCFAWHSK